MYIYKTDNKLVVGVTYWYNLDGEGEIFDNVRRIKELGIKVIRVPLYCNPNSLFSAENNRTERFYYAVEYFGGLNVSLMIHHTATEEYLRFYLEHWRQHLSYIQILNEPEVTSSWAEGAYYLDDEIVNKFMFFKNITDEYDLNVKYYVNFSPLFVARSNLVTLLGSQVDFLGYDSYMSSVFFLNPRFIEVLRKISGKDVIVTEFGSASQNENEQADFILNNLEMFKNMGIEQAWIFSWNGENGDPSYSGYAIRNKLAEEKVAEWIERNS